MQRRAAETSGCFVSGVFLVQRRLTRRRIIDELGVIHQRENLE
jgi:hypothetical protein